MDDYFQVLPSIKLNKSPASSTAAFHNEPQNTLRKRCSTSALPSCTFSKLVRGANDFLSFRNDANTESEREEARKLERKQILGLRMKNVRSLYL